MTTMSRRLAVQVAVVVALTLGAAAPSIAGSLNSSRQASGEQTTAVQFDMDLGADGVFAIDATGSAVETGMMCAHADELAREYQALTTRRIQLYVLFVCHPYTPWDGAPETRPSDICGSELCFTLHLHGSPLPGGRLSWRIYNAEALTGLSGTVQGKGTGAAVGDNHYLLTGTIG